eukprot:1731722-Rhodomonas_salina.1
MAAGRESEAWPRGGGKRESGRRQADREKAPVSFASRSLARALSLRVAHAHYLSIAHTPACHDEFPSPDTRATLH